MTDPESPISEEPFKIGMHQRGEGIVEFQYNHVYEPQLDRQPQRLLIAPQGGQVDLLLRLAREMPAPYSILYVLVAPQSEAAKGRYLLSERSDEDVFELLTSFREFFEGDARHHLWIGSETDGSLLVYDQHNVIYAYGALDQFSAILRAQGLEAGQVHFPFPHTHHFRSSMNAFEDRLLGQYPWLWNPLEDVDSAEC